MPLWVKESGGGLRGGKKPCKIEGKYLLTGEVQPHNEHDVQQRAVRETTLLVGAVFSTPPKQRNAKISLGMHSSCPIYYVRQLTIVGRDILTFHDVPFLEKSVLRYWQRGAPHRNPLKANLHGPTSIERGTNNKSTPPWPLSAEHVLSVGMEIPWSALSKQNIMWYHRGQRLTIPLWISIIKKNISI